MLILETERLYLKILGEDAAPDVVKFYQENREFFKTWESSKRDDFFSCSYQKMLLKLEKEEVENGIRIKFWIFLKEENKLIGFLNFGNIIRGSFESCFLGYKLAKDQIGKGYMTEALKEAMDYYFNLMKLHRIEVNVMSGNDSSRKVLESLGFVEEGTSEKYLKINDQWEDHTHYVMLKEHYQLLCEKK